MRDIKKLRQRSIDCDLKMELWARVLSSRDFQETGSRGVAATGATAFSCELPQPIVFRICILNL